MNLTETSSIKDLRQAIYTHFNIQNYSSSYKSIKLRKVCAIAQGLDLRKRSDVVFLAKQIGVLPHPMLQEPLVTDAHRNMVNREFSRIRKVNFSAFFTGNRCGTPA